MKSLVQGLGAAAIALQCARAEAQISYSYLEGTLSAHEIDTSVADDADAVGGGLRASYAVIPNFHVFAGYRYAELDDFDLQTTLALAGIGAHYDLSATRSVFLDVAAVAADLELRDPGVGTIQTDDDGYGVSIGYREINQTPLEFRLSIDYIALNDAETSDTTMDVSLQYRLARRLKLIGGFQFGGDDNMFRAGIRYYLPEATSGRR